MIIICISLTSYPDLRHGIRPVNRDAATNAWTPVNTSNEQCPSQGSSTNGCENERKRKRSPMGLGNGIGTSRYGPGDLPSHPIPRGLGITLPSQTPIAPSRLAPSLGRKIKSNGFAGQDVRVPSGAVRNGKNDPRVVQNGKSDDKAEGKSDESDSDADALGLLQRVADAESEDEEEEPPASASQLKVRQIRPSGPSQGWQEPPPHTPTIQKYTIYSPLVKGESV